MKILGMPMDLLLKACAFGESNSTQMSNVVKLGASVWVTPISQRSVWVCFCNAQTQMVTIYS